MPAKRKPKKSRPVPPKPSLVDVTPVDLPAIEVPPVEVPSADIAPPPAPKTGPPVHGAGFTAGKGRPAGQNRRYAFRRS